MAILKVDFIVGEVDRVTLSVPSDIKRIVFSDYTPHVELTEQGYEVVLGTIDKVRKLCDDQWRGVLKWSGVLNIVYTLAPSGYMFPNMDDVISVLQLHNIVSNVIESNRTCADGWPYTETLFIPYLPFARQDRNTSMKSPYSLSIFADLLNSAVFDAVVTVDVHSEVAFDLIEGLVSIPQPFLIPTDLLSSSRIGSCSNPVNVIPDKGAYKKQISEGALLSTSTHPIFNDLGIETFNILLDKKRDPTTGAINISVAEGCFGEKQTNEIFEVGDVLEAFMFDDICDGGTTFVLGMKEFLNSKHENGTCINDLVEFKTLIVTHGIFSKDFGDLLQTFDRILTLDYNSFVDDPQVLKEVGSTLTYHSMDFSKNRETLDMLYGEDSPFRKHLKCID